MEKTNSLSRCIGYIINLIIQAFLFIEVINLEKLTSYDLEDEDGELTDKKIKKARFRLLEPLNKGYNIVIYINKSPARTDVFRRFVGKLISMNNRTK